MIAAIKGQLTGGTGELSRRVVVYKVWSKLAATFNERITSRADEINVKGCSVAFRFLFYCKVYACYF